MAFEARPSCDDLSRYDFWSPQRKGRRFHSLLKDKTMPTVFSHAVAATAMGTAYSAKSKSKRFWIASMACAAIPDLDVLAFSLGIPYEHTFGHRGFSHSLTFSAILALAVTYFLFKDAKALSRKWFGLVIYFFFCTASHGILDAFTNGGLGIAFFAPFDNTRYFFPWRPLIVSPIGLRGLFSAWGIGVLRSEFLWIWRPSLTLIFLIYFVRKL